jgi:glutamyl-tRNA synthetase
MSEVIVRMPPSPTGGLHLGTARTALFNYLFAKNAGGKIIFRWEDTDKERSKKEFETEILDGLAWLGMDFEKESSHFFRQSENREVHTRWLEKLWEMEKVFPCFVTPAEIEAQRNEATKQKTNFVFWSPFRNEKKEVLEEKMKSGEKFVWRLRTPKDQDVQFTDLIRGDISVSTNTLGDFVVARGDGSVLYMLANVVDDWTQGVTHVLRGEDHISNTPKQILLYQSLGANLPQFGHIPLVLDAQKRKLSKRNVDPDTCVLIKDFQEKGFLPEAVVNGLVLLGWNPKSTEEVFSFDQLVDAFDLGNVNPGAAQYNFEKMKWFNTHWVRTMDLKILAKRFTEFSGETCDEKVLEVAREKSRDLHDIKAQLEYLIADPDIDTTLLLSEKMNIDQDMVQKVLPAIGEMLGGVCEDEFNREKLREVSTEKIAELEVKNGQFLSPFRIALSNRPVSVGPFEIAEIIGKAETLRRIERAQK